MNERPHDVILVSSDEDEAWLWCATCNAEVHLSEDIVAGYESHLAGHSDS